MFSAAQSIIYICAYLLSVRAAFGSTDNPRVVLSLGSVEGLEQTTVLGRSHYTFKGIPYAAPPVGNLRFKAPQPPANWSDVLLTYADAPACLQPLREVPFPITYNEDCLYLNVFTPYLQPKNGKGMPVIVWIHGGKFYQGSSATEKYGVDFLLMKDVVVVLMNYRLGIFGYLNMNLAGAQGNAALKDAVMALKWVQTEISKFGGDPSLVTIVGDSSGSDMVSMLYYSPMSKGLFSRAVSQSGSSLSDTAFLPSTANLGLKMAEALDCPIDSPQSAVSCLREVDGVILAEKQKIFKGVKGAENPFLPTIEQDLGEEVFLPDYPIKMMETTGDIPYLMGFTDGEGLMFLKDPETNPDQFEKIQEDFIPYLPVYMLENEQPEVLQRIATQFQNFYLGFNSSVNDTMYGFINYNTDREFSYCISKTAQIISNRAPVYLYYFNYAGNFQRRDRPFHKLNVTGVSHGEELGYLFYRPCFVKEQYNISAYPKDMKMVETMVTLWTNFATYGDPVPPGSNLKPTWEPVKGKLTRHLIINDPLVMAPYPVLEDRLAFWDNIFQSLYGEATHLRMDRSYSVYIIVYFLLLFCAILGIYCYFRRKQHSCYSILD
ncbi:hypothetical protein J6590_092289 [Homalodisca vitripennis]|nr:hypothetical protein J6590_092289 [Homalodisca vitripennis]